MRAPDFIVVGAHRAGTTSLFRRLGDHAAVQLPPVKEPHFFVAPTASSWTFANGTSPMPELVTTVEDYDALFAHVPETMVTGEASVLYLPLHDEAVPAIRGALGADVRIVVAVRDPADRAYSAYLYNAETYPDERATSFGAALDREESGAIPVGMPPTMEYLAMSRYADGIAAFRAAFTNVHIVEFDRLVHGTDETLAALGAFLGIGPFPPAPLVHLNGSGHRWSRPLAARTVNSRVVVRARRGLKHRAPAWHRRAHGVARALLGQSAPPLDPQDRARCIESVSDDIGQVEDLLGRALPHWRTVERRVTTGARP